MQITNVNKRFTAFPAMKNMKNIINNRAKLQRTLMNSFNKKFEEKVSTSHEKFMRMISFKMRNLKGLKNDILDQQL